MVANKRKNTSSTKPPREDRGGRHVAVHPLTIHKKKSKLVLESDWIQDCLCHNDQVLRTPQLNEEYARVNHMSGDSKRGGMLGCMKGKKQYPAVILADKEMAPSRRHNMAHGTDPEWINSTKTWNTCVCIHVWTQLTQLVFAKRVTHYVLEMYLFRY